MVRVTFACRINVFRLTQRRRGTGSKDVKIDAEVKVFKFEYINLK
jgi:hypothetical protein